MDLKSVFSTHTLFTSKWQTDQLHSSSTVLPLFSILLRVNVCVKYDRPPARPLADMNVRKLNGQYHSIQTEEVTRNCVVCTKHVAVNNLSRNQISKTNLVCVTLHVTESLFPLVSKRTAGKSGIS